MKVGENFIVTKDIFLYQHEIGDVIQIKKVSEKLVEYIFEGKIYYTTKSKIKYGSIRKIELLPLSEGEVAQ